MVFVIIKNTLFMMKIYTKKNLLSKSTRLTPKLETVRFLLDYSKAFRVVKTKTNYTIELHLN